MKHAVGTVERRVEDVGLTNVPAHLIDFYARVARRAVKVLTRASHEIVVDHDFSDVLLGQLVDSMRADQPGTSDYDQSLPTDVHLVSIVRLCGIRRVSGTAASSEQLVRSAPGVAPPHARGSRRALEKIPVALDAAGDEIVIGPRPRDRPTQALPDRDFCLEAEQPLRLRGR